MSGFVKFLISEKNINEIGLQEEHTPDILDILPLTQSAATTYDDDLLIQVVYYRSNTQTEANRVGQVDVTYNNDEYPSIVSCKLYNTTDGSTLIKTITLTYTWDDDELEKIERAIT